MLRVTKFLARIAFAVALVFCVNAFAFDPGLDIDGDEDLGMAVVIPQRNCRLSDIRSEPCAEAASFATCQESAPVKLISLPHRPAPPLSLLGSPHLIVPLRP